MSSCYSSRFVDDVASFPQRMLRVLECLQTQSHSFRSSTQVSYIYDLVQQQTLYTTGSVAELLGYSAVEIAEMESIGLAELIHPDDLDQVAAYYQRFCCLRYGEVISVKYRMKRANGTWCWLRSQETLLMQETIGQVPSQVLGMIQNISRLSIAASERSMQIRRFRRRVSLSKRSSLPQKIQAGNYRNLYGTKSQEIDTETGSLSL